MLRALLCIAAFAAAAGCEIEPGTKRPPPPSTTDTAAPAPAGSAAAAPTPAAPTPPTAPPPAPPPSAAGGAPGTVAADPKCTQAATHIAELQSAAITDADQKAAFQQQQATFVQQISQACTKDAWSPRLIDCIVKAADAQGLQPCSDILNQERTAKAAAAAGSAAPAAGSAAPAAGSAAPAAGSAVPAERADGTAGSGAPAAGSGAGAAAGSAAPAAGSGAAAPPTVHGAPSPHRRTDVPPQH